MMSTGMNSSTSMTGAETARMWRKPRDTIFISAGSGDKPRFAPVWLMALLRSTQHRSINGTPATCPVSATFIAKA